MWHRLLYVHLTLATHHALSILKPKREMLPYTAFTSFKSSYEEPTLSEGFKEIKRVNWVFEGSAEERERWNMWLQIDGK